MSQEEFPKKEYKDLSLSEKLQRFNADQLKDFATAEGLPEDATPEQIANSMDNRRQSAAQAVGLPADAQWDQITRMSEFKAFLADAAKEGISADVKLARIIAERAGANTDWQNVQTLGGNEFFAGDQEGSKEFEGELSRLGYEVNHQGTGGWEVRKQKEQ